MLEKGEKSIGWGKGVLGIGRGKRDMRRGKGIGREKGDLGRGDIDMRGKGALRIVKGKVEFYRGERG